MTSLPVLKDTKDEILKSSSNIKRYCLTCDHCYNENTKNKGKFSSSNRCKIFHGAWCSLANRNFDCNHWIEEKASSLESIKEPSITYILFLPFVFASGFVFSKLFL